MLKLAKIFGLLLLVVISANAQSRFCEINGYVSMEAENANQINNWVKVAGKSGSAYRDNVGKQGGYLRFQITFTRLGRYYVYFLDKCDPPPGIVCVDANDCYVTLDGKSMISSVDNTSTVIGMRTGRSTFAWTCAPKVPDNQEHLRGKPVYLNVTSTGTKTLEVKSRGKGYTVDKVQLQLNDDSRPIGLGYDQTFCSNKSVTPYFRLQPESQIVQVNRTASFTVDAGGTPVLSYQWQKNGVNIEGATSYRYRASSAQLADNGTKFTCVATNSAGSTTSQTVTLVVYDLNSGQVLEIEAEAMTLAGGYKIDTGSLNGSAITIDTSQTAGTATTNFTGPAGIYFLAISVIPENDGAPSVRVSVNQDVVIDKTYPQDDMYANLAWRIQFIAEDVSLKAGNVITINGTRNLGGYARVDKLILVPKDNTGILDMTNGKGWLPLAVSPNPVTRSGLVKCRVPGNSGPVQVTLATLNQGPVLAVTCLVSAEGMVIISLPHKLQPGMYFLKVNTGKMTYMQKLLITQ